MMPFGLRDLRPYLPLLDIKVSHSFPHPKRANKWKSLQPHIIREVYESRRQHTIGKIAMEKWAAEQKFGRGPGAAFCFWYSLDGSNKLPQTCLDGLETLVANACFDTAYLIGYKVPTNIPRGLEFLPAEGYMTEAAFKAMLVVGEKKIPGFVALLADYVRLEAAAGQSKHDFLWVVDCDTIWTSQAIETPKQFCHHSFATYDVNKASFLNRTPLKRHVEQTVSYCIQPRDYWSIATPWMFPRGSPALTAVLEKMRQQYAAEGQPAWEDTNYDHNMKMMAKVINDQGLREAYNSPAVFSSIPYFRASHALEALSVTFGLYHYFSRLVRFKFRFAQTQF